MDQFKPNKPKAAINAGMHVAYDEAGKIIDSLAKVHPNLALTLILIRANFGALLAYKQEKLNQFTEYLMNNQNIFTPEIMSTKEFQEGLAIFLESYFKLRSDEKLKLAQNIFLDFTESLEMPLYPLERYNDTLEKISQTGIQLLGFIASEVPKLRLEFTKRKIHEHGNTTSIKSITEWTKVYGDPKPINFFIEEHIKKLSRQQMKNYSGTAFLSEEERIKKLLREPFTIAQSELEQLGLAKGNDATRGWSSNEYFFNLTDYGRKFTSIIKPEDVYKFISE